MYANNPALARKWQKEYYNAGGDVNKQAEMLIYLNEGGSWWERGKDWVNKKTQGSGQVERNQLYSIYIGERNQGKTDLKFPEWLEQNQGKHEVAGTPEFTDGFSMVLDFLPVVGDVKGLGEAGVALWNRDYVAAGLLAGAAVIGLVPGVGDAAARPFKAAAKVSSRVFKAIVRGLQDHGLTSEAISQMQGDILMSVGRASIEVVNATEEEALIIRRHILELTREAESRGIYVSKADTGDYQVIHQNNLNTGELRPVIIEIPKTYDKQRYLTALEEFNHALHKAGQHDNSLEKIIPAETFAKGKAVKDARVEVTQEDIQRVADTFLLYLHEIPDLAPSQVYDEVVDTIPDPDAEIWKLLGMEPVDKQRMKTDLDYRDAIGDAAYEARERVDQGTAGISETHDGIITGARPKKKRTIVATIDGEPVVMDDVDNIVDILAEATGKSQKTIRNKLAKGETIEDPGSGVLYREAKEGDNFGPSDLGDAEDAREATLGKIKGYDGTFSDLMRDHDIDPQSGEAKGIHQSMKRGHEWNGYRLTDVEDFDTRQAAIRARQKESTSIQGKRNNVERMKRIGFGHLLDNQEIVDEFFTLWKKPTETKVADLSRNAKAESAMSKAFREARSKAYGEYLQRPGVRRQIDAYNKRLAEHQAKKPAGGVNSPGWEAWEKGRDELNDMRSDITSAGLAYANKFGHRARAEQKRIFIRKKTIQDPKFTEWRQFFLKHAPEKIEHLKTAKEQKEEIFDLLSQGFLGKDGQLDTW